MEFFNFPVGIRHFFVRVAVLTESGLVNLWVAQTKINLTLDVRNALKQKKIAQSLWKLPKALSLKGNIVVVFYMLPLLAIIPGIIFVLELAGPIGRFVLTCCKFAWTKIKEIWNGGCFVVIKLSRRQKSRIDTLPFN